MNTESKKIALEFFRKEMAEPLAKKIKEGHALKKFKVNPFTLLALSKGVLGEATPENMAKALLYPRIFGTSLSTTFGDKMQKFCVLLGAEASGINGMDIEFVDKVTSKKVVVQLKAGPNTINADDVTPIINKMISAHRLLLQNRVNDMPIFGIAVTYGTTSDLSGHYKKINDTSLGNQLEIPIFVGQDFWMRLTGDSDFYLDLISVFTELFEKEDYSDDLQNDIQALSEEIENKLFTNGVLDSKKF